MKVYRLYRNYFDNDFNQVGGTLELGIYSSFDKAKAQANVFLDKYRSHDTKQHIEESEFRADEVSEYERINIYKIEPYEVDEGELKDLPFDE
jgi:hypothetical protein